MGALLFEGQLAVAAPAPKPPAMVVHTRYFPYRDRQYLHRDQRQSGAVLLPEVVPGARLPLVVLLHGINPAGDLHLWLGGASRDLRPLAASLMASGAVRPFVLAAPSQTKSAGSPHLLWDRFEITSFVDAVVEASAGAVEIDREQVVVMGHSGAGCNPNGGLASAFSTEDGTLPRALVAIDPCLDTEMGMAMSQRPASIPLLLWWQSSVWPREPLAFWAALTLNQEEQRLDRMQALELSSANPHEAIVSIAFELAVRELFPGRGAPPADQDD